MSIGMAEKPSCSRGADAAFEVELSPDSSAEARRSGSGGTRRHRLELGVRAGCPPDLVPQSLHSKPVPSPRPPASASTAPAGPTAHEPSEGARAGLAGLAEAELVGVDLPGAWRPLGSRCRSAHKRGMVSP